MKDFLHYLFVPRESNNHRSKILHHEVLLLFLAIFISALVTLAGVHREYPAVLGESTNISIETLLTQTNMKRQAQGLTPLKLDLQLSQAAKLKADDMFAKNYWAHVSPEGTTPWVFIKNAGYEYLYAGENLARGYSTSSDIVNAWMASPTHRENILSPNYTDIGFAIESGVLTGSDTILVVQEFGKKYEAEATPSNSETVSTSQSATPDIIAANENSHQPSVEVAAIQNEPLLDTSRLKDNTAFFFLLFFIGVLLIDSIVTERKNIARVFSHNVDHILFLLFVLLAGILIAGGNIL